MTIAFFGSRQSQLVRQQKNLERKKQKIYQSQPTGVNPWGVLQNEGEGRVLLEAPVLNF